MKKYFLLISLLFTSNICADLFKTTLENTIKKCVFDKETRNVQLSDITVLARNNTYSIDCNGAHYLVLLDNLEIPKNITLSFCNGYKLREELQDSVKPQPTNSFGNRESINILGTNVDIYELRSEVNNFTSVKEKVNKITLNEGSKILVKCDQSIYFRSIFLKCKDKDIKDYIFKFELDDVRVFPESFVGFEQVICNRNFKELSNFFNDCIRHHFSSSTEKPFQKENENLFYCKDLFVYYFSKDIQFPK